MGHSFKTGEMIYYKPIKLSPESKAGATSSKATLGNFDHERYFDEIEETGIELCSDIVTSEWQTQIFNNRINLKRNNNNKTLSS